MLVAAPAAAQVTTSWTNTTNLSAFFHFGTNWDNGVPGASDIANFNQADTYNVNFSLSNATVNSDTVNVSAGDVEFFDGLATKTYSITSDVLIDDGNLTLDTVDLDVGNDIDVQNGGSLTVESDAAGNVTSNADFAGTIANDGEIELLDGVLLNTPVYVFLDPDLELTGNGRLYVSGAGNTATMGSTSDGRLQLRHSGNHTIEAINGATLILDRVEVDQSSGNATVNAGAGSTIIMRGDPFSGGSNVTGGRTTTTGDGQILNEDISYVGGTVELSSAAVRRPSWR